MFKVNSMKKDLVVMLSVLMSMIASVASAYDFEADGIYYDITSSSNPLTVAVSHNGNNTYTNKVTIPESVIYGGRLYSVTSIGDYAFADCSSLTSIIIPSSVTRIDNYTFWGCTGLTSITIPNSVTSIGYQAFQGCSGLTSITIPNSVTSIADTSFSGCYFLIGNFINNSSLTSSIAWCATLCDEETSDGLMIKNNSIVKCRPWATTVSIPNKVTGIAENAFENTGWYHNQSDGLLYLDNWLIGCKGSKPIGKIIIKSGTKGIASNVFFWCTGMTSIEIPNCVTYIGEHAFEGCEGLASVIIPNSVTSIGYEAFRSCKGLTSITIPNSVTSIGERTFYRCPNLTSVTVGIPIPLAINYDMFINRANATLYVPAGCKAAYEAADVWKDFKEIIEMDPNVTDISQMDNVIYLEETEAKTGSQKTLSFKMKNSAAIRGFQFDLYLPEGMTVVKSSKGRIQGSLTEARLPEEDEHSLTFSEQADGAIRFLCSSQYDETFTGNDGEIATLTVNIADNMPDGDYAVEMKNMKLTETDISKYYETEIVKCKLTISSYTLGDINNDGVVDVSDYTGVANHIHGNTPTEFNARAADVDENGTIDVSDYTGIANIIHTGSIYGGANVRMAIKPKRQKVQENDPE